MKFSFTKYELEKLRVSPKRYNVWDAKLGGLGITVFPGGAKSFFYLKKIEGKIVRLTIGDFPQTTIEQARDKAKVHDGKLAKWKLQDEEERGPHPLQRQARPLTFQELVDDYLARRVAVKAKNPAAAKKRVDWMVKRYLGDEEVGYDWRGRRLRSIRKSDVNDLLRKLAETSGNVTANRVVELVRRLFFFAQKSEGHTGDNPAKGVELYDEQSRTRFLKADELFRLRAALRESSVDLQDFVLLALYTGARRGDVLSMRWEDLDLDRATWTIPDPKNKNPYVVPLVPAVVKILKRRRSNSPWIFPSRGASGHLVEVKRSWALLMDRAKIDGLRIHDLRRTLGSWQAGLGSSLLVIGKSLGHDSTASTEIYSRLDLDPVRASVSGAVTAMIAASKTKPKQLKAANAS